MNDPSEPSAPPDSAWVETPTLDCPYPGLRPFGCDEAHLFFGRARQIGEMLNRLEDRRFMAVVGVSGCGKSSLVRAGLIPAVRDGYLSGEVDEWRIAVMRPGDAPFARLAEVLVEPQALGPERASQANAQAFLEATLRRGRLGLAEAVLESRLPPGTGLLLVVDQFEELFRFRAEGGAPDEAHAFVDLLLAAARAAEPGQPGPDGEPAPGAAPILAVLTMRSDFLGSCAIFTGLPEALNDSQFLTPRLTRDQYRDAICEPAIRAGGRLAPALVTRLLNEMGEDPDQLPVLQHCLMRMWTRAAARPVWDRSLDERDYEAAGGLAQALDAHCDRVFEGLADERLRLLAESLFRRLSERGEGRDTRCPATLGSVAAAAGAEPAELIPVIEAFRRPDRSFLTPPPPEPLDPGRTLDISHESLIRHWGRLNAWVESEAESAAVYRRLLDAAGRRRRRRGEAALLHDEDLKAALDWQARQRPTPGWAERYGGGLKLVQDFLEESRLGQESELAAAEVKRLELEESRRRELEQARELAAERARSARNMGLWLAACFAFLLVSAGFAVYGFVKKAEAERQRAEAERQTRIAQGATRSALDRLANWLVLESRSKKDQGPELALLLAIEATRAAPGPAAESALREALRAFRSLPLVGHEEPVLALAFAAGGRTLASGSADDSIRLWDPAAPRAEPRVLRGHVDDVTALAAAPDGQRLASASADGTVRLWDLTDGQPPLVLAAYQGRLEALALAPDGRTLAIGGEEGARLLDLAEPRAQPRSLAGPKGWIRALAFGPDGRILAGAGEDGVIRLWTPGRPEVPALVLGGAPGANGEVLALAFRPDGRALAAAGADQRVRIWDLDRPEAPPTLLAGHQGPVTSLAYSPDGDSLASTSKDRTLRVWDLSPERETQQRRRPRVFPCPSGEPRSAAFSPDGSRLASAATDGTVRLWDLSAPADAAWILDGQGGDLFSLALAPDGRTLAAAGKDGKVRLWDASRPEAPPRVLGGHRGPVLAVAFASDGRLASGGADRSLRLWDLSAPDGAPRSLGSQDGPVRAVVFAPDGSLLASGGDDTMVRLWDLAGNGAGNRVLAGHQAKVQDLDISPDGRTLASASADQTVRLWDLKSPGSAPAVLSGHQDLVRALAYSPDGATLASGSYDGTIRLWDAGAPGSPAREIHTGAGRTISLAWSPDGRTLAAGFNGAAIRLWDAARPLEGSWLLEGHETYVPGLAFVPGGTLLASVSGDGTLRLWDLARSPGVRVAAEGGGDGSEASRIRRLGARACELVGRNLAADEWDRYLAGESERLSCPDWPIHPSLLQAALDLAEGGRLVQAEAEYRKVLGRFGLDRPDPRRETGRRAALAAAARAQELARAGDIQGAAAALGEARTLDPDWLIDPEQEAARDAAGARLAQGDALASRDDPVGAVAAYGQALALDPGLHLDPQARARGLQSAALLRLVPGLARSGQVPAALERYARALALKGAGPDPELDARLCRWGALWGLGVEVLPLCERAVAAAPGGGPVLDSRGMARALSGDRVGAAADFAAYLGSAEAEGLAGAVQERHRRWIAALETGADPLDPATLESLRREEP